MHLSSVKRNSLSSADLSVGILNFSLPARSTILIFESERCQGIESIQGYFSFSTNAFYDRFDDSVLSPARRDDFLLEKDLKDRVGS